MLLNRIKWAALRLFFILCLSFTVFTFGLGLYLIAPLVCYGFYNDWRFWKYLNTFPRLITGGCGLLYRFIVNNNGYRTAFPLPLTAAPAGVPDLNMVKIRDDWNYGDTCGTCFDCCTLIKCPFHNYEEKRCNIYKSFFWNYFNCGRYPASQKNIDFYSCKKWEMKIREDLAA